MYQIGISNNRTATYIIFQILEVLSNNDDVTNISKIVMTTNISQNALCEKLEVLKVNGLVEDKYTERRRYITITKKGKEFLGLLQRLKFAMEEMHISFHF